MIERQRIVRLVVKEILIGDDNIVIRHSIPIASTPPPSGDPPTPTRSDATRSARNYLLRSGSNATALRGSLFHPHSLPVLQHAGVQPFLDEPHHAPVRNPVLEELNQPPVVDGMGGRDEP